MPRYFLHVRDADRLLRDPDGIHLHDVEAARVEAIQSARELMADSIVRDGHIGIERSIVVGNDMGATLLVVPFRDAIRL